MENEISELIEYLDKKFTKLEAVIETKADKSDIQNLVETKADKSDINHLLDAIDGYAKKADTFFQEMVMLAHKVDRHEKWILQLARKLGVELDY